MQSGVLSADNLPDLLRGISQRRRQGVLEVHGSEGVTSVRFVQGRIVEVIAPQLTPIQEVVQWLSLAGYRVGDVKSYQEKYYSELLERLVRDQASADGGVSSKPITQEVLSGIIKHRILERLYALDVGAGSMYSFKVQMVETERDFSPSISVGQLLLDLVELASEREEFTALFPVDSYAKIANADAADTDDERSVLTAINAGAVLDDVAARSLLSSYHLRHALLGLLRRGAITVQEAADLKNGAPTGAGQRNITAVVDRDAAGPGSGRGDEGATLGALVEEPEVSVAKSSTSIGMLSAKLLQNSAVPSVVGFVILVCGTLAPFLFWAGLLSRFAD